MPLTKLRSHKTAKSLLGVALALTLHAVELAPVQADQATIDVREPWSRATPSGVNVGAAYMQISLKAGSGDRLIGARSERAGRVEVHTHIEEDGVMKMRKVEALDLTAGETLSLAPGGHHMMLFDLKTPLTKGETVPVVLIFEKAGEVTVEAKVAAIGAMKPAGRGAERGSGSEHHHH